MSDIDDIQIIIPITGNGSRFKAAEYERLKPFIEVHRQPIIEWVVKMFPGDEDKITFICRQEHLDMLDYVEAELRRIAPKSTIFPVKNWEKKGPVSDIMCASDVIDANKATMVCYCDYYMHWDYEGFKKDVKRRNCDGAVPCYSDFHPHLTFPKNLYASCLVDEYENLIEIREKFSWEKDKMKSLHSPGMYFFKSGRIMKKYCQQMMISEGVINGEYYVSLLYNYLVKDRLQVWCPVNVPYFCQWGTPEDLEEYLFWTNVVKGFGQ